MVSLQTDLKRAIPHHVGFEIRHPPCSPTQNDFAVNFHPGALPCKSRWAFLQKRGRDPTNQSTPSPFSCPQSALSLSAGAAKSLKCLSSGTLNCLGRHCCGKPQFELFGEWVTPLQTNMEPRSGVPKTIPAKV